MGSGRGRRFALAPFARRSSFSPRASSGAGWALGAAAEFYALILFDK